ncbi:ParB/RepB/Spo0J family partition protein [Sphingomonas sp. HDW15A]|uniref:ParB/RepB/Spo0J family partition protein n=1 Tax=Sphingomonas sp. HDW15A TaxID=2714942 RepID=UPI00140838BE|nr:ParB/RepB/Spo0J family partition protein [Sphingomonas sp. HDW15A]QIK96958.1 ParB/RepB/Spo0J family partition protein [Sphingomonas sp. HDW15A]
MSDNSRKHGLGRGLSALLGDPPAKVEEERQASGSGLRIIATADVRPNPAQPRKAFDDETITELAESIARHGVLQPILVRAVDGGYEIIAGERRWRAAQRAQLHELPAIVRSDGESSRAELALIENVQRQDLNAIEEAEGYSSLIEKYGHAQDIVAKLVGKSRSHVTNLLRLLKLPESVRQMLLRGDISMGHARALLSAPDPEAAARIVVSKGLSVRQTEALAKIGTEPRAKASERNLRSVDSDLAALERQLGDMLGLNVKVKHAGKGGTVSLAYSSLDQLDMICQRLSGEPI